MRGLATYGDVALVVHGSGWLEAYDVQDPARPVALGPRRWLPSSWYGVRDIAVTGDTLAVAVDGGGLVTVPLGLPR